MPYKVFSLIFYNTGCFDILDIMDEKINEKLKQSVFWIETDKIHPNPFQPRREFDPVALQDLANSIREYGLLQPVTVIRKEKEVASGTVVEYELLAGERRLRASKLLGLRQIPVIVHDDMSDKVKLELALVENLQREDLNAIERALAFKKLIDEFGMLQREIGEKVGKSREVVANTLRLLTLPEDMQQAVSIGVITEGHTRPLLMLAHQPTDQRALYNDIVQKHLSVREAERAARVVAKERVRGGIDSDTRMIQDKLETALGTRVSIEKKGPKGRISIEFFSEEEFHALSEKIETLSHVPATSLPFEHDQIHEEDLVASQEPPQPPPLPIAESIPFAPVLPPVYAATPATHSEYSEAVSSMLETPELPPMPEYPEIAEHSSDEPPVVGNLAPAPPPINLI